jgi:hypothetical protein
LPSIRITATMVAVTVRELTADDAPWVAELMEQRRQVYAGYSPVFWRPAVGVIDLHTRFLRRQIASPANVALRTDHGFIIGQRRAAEGFVDDFAVGPDGSWDADGTELLRQAWQRLSSGGGFEALRVVTAHADEEKSALLRGLSLRLAEQWWVRELPSAGPLRPPARVAGTGFSGILGPAPPVYAPGGPVLLVDGLADDAELPAVEREATELGALLLVIPVPVDSPRAAELPGLGWTVASDWYLGQPAN